MLGFFFVHLFVFLSRGLIPERSFLLSHKIHSTILQVNVPTRPWGCVVISFLAFVQERQLIMLVEALK